VSAAPRADTLTGSDVTTSIRMVSPASLLLVCACAKSGQANKQPAPRKVTVAKVVERTVQDWDEFTGRLSTRDEPLTDVVRWCTP
jgi:hypothetical protein